MIKAKVSATYKDIERIFAGGSIQKEILKVWSTEADAYVFEAWSVLEMEGPLPLSIRANGEPLIDYRIYGNTEQSGTPTPENPIIPIWCGERVYITGLSEPLCGIGTYSDSLNLSTGMLTRRIKKLVLTGEEAWYKGGYAFNSTPMGMEVYKPVLCTHYQYYDGASSQAPTNSISTGSGTGTSVWIKTQNHSDTTIEQWKAYLAAQYAAGTPVTVWYVLAEPDVSTISIPSGLTGTIEGRLIQNGTPTPETPIYPTANGIKQADDTYSIPYGYKLQILSNYTVTNIYLGEMQTTRRIKKLVLTGEENWIYSLLASHNGFITNAGYVTTSPTDCICTHYRTAWANTNNTIYFLSALDGRFVILDDRFNNANDFKAYLAAQYAAGTPVTVWYVLAEPENTVVNEPLMKIGNYADTVSMEQAGVSIPTNKGSTAIDYDGEKRLITSDGYELVDKNQNGFLLSGPTLRPSKMYIKYKGR